MRPDPLLADRPNQVDDLDLSACAREPIAIPGAIQPHGHLLAFENRPGLELAHASIAAAAEILPASLASAIGLPLLDVLQVDEVERLADSLRRLPERVHMHLGKVRARASGAEFDAVAHKSLDGLIVLELQEVSRGDLSPLQDYYPLVRDALDRLSGLCTIDAILAACSREIRAISGFDRALVYRFDSNWEGTVVAEDRNDRLPSYAGLRFPASDIPSQARQLYSLNHLRLIPDASYAPVPIYPGRDRKTGRPIDLSLAFLRSVSPMHLEYMRNMRTPASMSVSLMRADKLWGLISCHHAEPKRVSPAACAACDLIGQFAAVQIAAKEEASRAIEAARLREIESLLLAKMAAAQGSVADGLQAAGADLCALAGAAGAAVVTPQDCRLTGQTPPEATVLAIAEWLRQQSVVDVFETNALATVLPRTEAFDPAVAGLLAIRISRLHAGFIMWFRPEIVRTVVWGGDPEKPVVDRLAGRVGPRKSFDAWQETVRGTASPWTDEQIASVRSFRSAIVDILLKAAEERAELADRLERINSELSAFSHSVSHDLRAPFRHISGYAELLLEIEGERLTEKGQRFISVIIESAQTAGLLVDALLNFSRMGSTSVTKTEVDAQAMAQEAVRAQLPDTIGRHIEWRVGPLPSVRADALILRQVFYNLIENAIKYTRGKEPTIIEIGSTEDEKEAIFFVKDNGVGFEMTYAHKLFGVFQRLHRMEDYEGVGIGLANVRRMIQRHAGRTWAEGVLGQGATFFFSLPHAEPEFSDGDQIFPA
jgi:light-regulated signal transduction histidine kinase (bacteriophytochrome)